MKRILFICALLFAGCGRKDKYVNLVNEAENKTVMIEVPMIVREIHFILKKEGLQVQSSTVTVKVQGSGVFVSPKGHILTCAHFFENGKLAGTVMAVLRNGTRLPVKVLCVDPTKDLALFKVEGAHPYAVLATKLLQEGEEVIAVGNPLGLNFSVSHGIVSHVNRSLEFDAEFTQTDAAINPGNSGGPLFNLDGELVGINARFIATGNGLGFAIAPEVIQEFLNLFIGIN
jgi:serine protease Do